MPRKSFEIELVIDDEVRRFQITPSFQAITEIEAHEIHKANDGALLSILTRFGRKCQHLSDYVAIIHGSIRAQSNGEVEVSATEVGEAIFEAGQAGFTVSCVEFLCEALGVNRRTARKVAAKKKTPKK